VLLHDTEGDSEKDPTTPEKPPQRKPVAKLRVARMARVRARNAVAFYKRPKGKKSSPDETPPSGDAPLTPSPLGTQGTEGFPLGTEDESDSAPVSTTGLTPEPESAYLSGELDLVADFTVEAREHIASIEKGLLRLEQNPEDKDAIHSVFRAFHSIKGLAGFLALDRIQTLTHEVETLLEEVRNGRYAVDSALVDVVLQSADYVSRSLVCLDALVAGKPMPLPALDPALVDLVRAVHQGKERRASATQMSPAAEPPQAASPAPGASDGAGTPRATEASRVKVDTRKLDSLVEMVGELVVAQSLLRHDERLKIDLNAPIALKISQMARITSEVQQITMAMRMVPIQGLFQKTARLARDLSRKSGKLVEFVTSGEDTELDRNIVEELADPLVHMIRNSMDHGLETPEERVKAGKSATGKVGLRASHQAGMILVEIFDDGRGLDAAKLRARGIERGLISENLSYSEEELFGLIFEPGFSTAAKVTDISGRGVGMDVVKRHIERLRGRIEIRSQLGAGATFLLKLPLTLAIIDGLVVGVGGERYVMPIVAVREMFRPAKNTVTSIEGNREMVRLRDQVMPVVRLSERFGVRAANQSLEQSLLIVTETESRTFSLVVDELLGRQEVVIKSLGEVFGNVAGVAGGAILGDGRVGLILDPKGVFEAGAKQAATLHA
jgi:two-component system chemotaxis sensor kinase CheA